MKSYKQTTLFALLALYQAFSAQAESGMENAEGAGSMAVADGGAVQTDTIEKVDGSTQTFNAQPITEVGRSKLPSQQAAKGGSGKMVKIMILVVLILVAAGTVAGLLGAFVIHPALQNKKAKKLAEEAKAPSGMSLKDVKYKDEKSTKKAFVLDAPLDDDTSKAAQKALDSIKDKAGAKEKDGDIYLPYGKKETEERAKALGINVGDDTKPAELHTQILSKILPNGKMAVYWWKGMSTGILITDKAKVSDGKDEKDDKKKKGGK